MNQSEPLVIFHLDEGRYALRLSAVERVLRAVEVTPLPEAPEIVEGAINVQGLITPVINLRKRFDLPAQDLSLNDRFIIARTSRRIVALRVDSVSGVVEPSEQEIIPAEAVLPDGHIEGVIKGKDGLILITHLDQFLSLEEEERLHHAIEGSKKQQEGEP